MAKPLKITGVLPEDPAQLAAQRILRRRLREYYSHWPDPNDTPTAEQLHNQRISGKRLRYSAETLRDFYPDHLALLIDLLKRQQDLVGTMQDCVTQRATIAADLARRRRMRAKRDEIAGLEGLLADYDARHGELFTQLRDLWMGMTSTGFRSLLKKVVGLPGNEPKEEVAVEAATIG